MSNASFTTIEMLGRLIAFDTTSRNSNLELIAFVEDYLAGFGARNLRVDFEPGRKTNLYATLGPEEEGGIVLSGHTDVVPVDGQAWDTDPFRMTRQDGLIYGRGAADMKGFIAAALAFVPSFLSRPLKKPIHFALSCDEEMGCRGVRPLVEHLRGRLPKPEAVFVGEPTLMRVVDSHKEAHTFETVVTGKEAHSAQAHLGVNAIMAAGDVISEINRLAAMMIERGDPSGRFDPPYTTVHIGMIEGGTAKNIVPRRCAFTWETRLIPGADPDEVPQRLEGFTAPRTAAMRRAEPVAGIMTRRTNVVPGLKPDPGSPAEGLALLAAEANSTAAVSYATEAGLFQGAGIPAIVCGPGSIEQAHKPNEFIALSELEKCEAFLARLARHCWES